MPAPAAILAKPPKPAKPAKPPKPAQSAKKGSALIFALIALVVVAVAAAGGGYWFLHRGRPAPQQPAPVAVAPVASMPAVAATPQQVTLASEAAAPAGSQSASQAKTSASAKAASSKTQKKAAPAPPTTQTAAPSAPPPVVAAPAAPPVPAPAPAPQPAGLGFDPKKIDPKDNSRLKFDLGRVPPAVNFTVEMDGKTFYKGTAGNRAGYDNLYVPPGLHQFRVEISAGSVEKSSNTVSFQFIAKKHVTLRVELKPQSNASEAGVPVLDPATQVIATIKADFSLFN
jgi:flagellar basal body-associated protein FliL